MQIISLSSVSLMSFVHILLSPMSSEQTEVSFITVFLVLILLIRSLPYDFNVVGKKRKTEMCIVFFFLRYSRRLFNFYSCGRIGLNMIYFINKLFFVVMKSSKYYKV